MNEPADLQQQGPLKLNETFTFVFSRAGDTLNVCAVMVDPESNSIIPETGAKALVMARNVIGFALKMLDDKTVRLVEAVIKGNAWPQEAPPDDPPKPH